MNVSTIKQAKVTIMPARTISGFIRNIAANGLATRKEGPIAAVAVLAEPSQWSVSTGSNAAAVRLPANAAASVSALLKIQDITTTRPSRTSRAKAGILKASTSR